MTGLALAATLAIILLVAVTPLPVSAQGRTLNDQLALVIPEINAYWTAMLKREAIQYDQPTVIVMSGAISTQCGRVTGNAYCPGERIVYLDQARLGKLWSDGNDFAVTAIIAHEWAHHLQGLLKLNRRGEYTIQRELQADCLAGLFVQYARARGLVTPGDLTEAVLWELDAGDPAGPPMADPQTYGAGPLRLQWFSQGYNATQLSACKMSRA